MEARLGLSQLTSIFFPSFCEYLHLEKSWNENNRTSSVSKFMDSSYFPNPLKSFPLFLFALSVVLKPFHA